MNDFARFLVLHGGPVLFAVVFAEQAGLPLPAAPWLLAAGALSAGGALNPVLAVALTALACLVADSIWFYVGRRGGKRVLRLFCRMSLSPNSCVGGSKGYFAQHGEKALIAAKFIPVIGGVMPPLAGALGMSATRFLAFDSLGSVLYGALYIAAGFLFHNQLLQAGALLKELGFSAALLGLLLVPAYIGFKYFQRRRASITRTAEARPMSRAAAAFDANVATPPATAVRILAPRLDYGSGTAAIPRPVAALSSAGLQSRRDGSLSSMVHALPCEL